MFQKIKTSNIDRNECVAWVSWPLCYPVTVDPLKATLMSKVFETPIPQSTRLPLMGSLSMNIASAMTLAATDSRASWARVQYWLERGNPVQDRQKSLQDNISMTSTAES